MSSQPCGFDFFNAAMIPANCYFFKLPAELKLAVISYLDQKRDLYNISKTSKWLEDIALKRLYKVVDIQIPAEKSSAWSTGGYLRLRKHVLKAIQEVTIRDGVMDHTQPQYSRRRRSDAGCPETYAMQVVEEIPQSQLKSFSFMHRSPISSRLVTLLNAKHGRSLRNLSYYAMATTILPTTTLPSSLESLECRSIEDGKTLGELVYASKDTLKALNIGEEKALVERYHRLRTAIYDVVPQPLHAFHTVVSLAQIRNLKKLGLVGLDLGPLVPQDVESALYLTNLEELVVESCVSSSEFFMAMTTIFTFAKSEAAPDPKPIPQLRRFLFRHEISTAAIKEAIVQFLNSFHGLQMLSLLFENGSMSLRLADIATNHSKTLKQLVLETRIQPRESLRIDTSRPFGLGGYTQQLWEEGTDDICRLCSNLNELSVGFPWNDEMIRIRESPLPKLLNLQTMHIRNFPESNTLLQMGDYTIREHATKFLDWTFGNVVGGSMPRLETLSIGPSVYESRFRGSDPSRKQIPEFLRTHHFMVDWAQTRFGRWSAMVTNVSEKYMEEMRGEKPMGGIFQQVWLK
ncbi:hypothetical protein LTS08_005188 [Lithohypha guttulata]|nr:hypothetical protein LTS08_005188 [Lithohypha guttulata]